LVVVGIWLVVNQLQLLPVVLSISPPFL